MNTALPGRGRGSALTGGAGAFGVPRLIAVARASHRAPRATPTAVESNISSQESPLRHRLSLLRERLPPAAGHRAPPPRESYRRRFVNVTIVARPRRSVGFGYV